MIKGLLDLHNVLRWVILILLLVSLVKAFTGWQQKKAFTGGDRRIWLFTLIATHLTLLVGLVQLFWGRFGILKTTLPADFNLMKDAGGFYRFFWVEHPLFMLLATIFITLGYGMSKKPFPDTVKFKRAFWLFFIALLMIMVAVPWPFRGEAIARPLFPGA